MPSFELDPRLAADTLAVATLKLCELRLMNDRRWPWLILVPRRSGITEFHELTPPDRTMLCDETARIAKALKTQSGADKINIGALGNLVPMLHLHVIARKRGDANWPGPVWGFGTAETYEAEAGKRLANEIREAVEIS